jgi:hypothetical protein
LPVFLAAHGAKVAKLAFSGLEQGNFYAPIAGKSNGSSRCRAGKHHWLPTLKQRQKHMDTADFNSKFSGVKK